MHVLRKLPGPVREAAVVAHYRRAGGASVLGPDCNAIIGLAASSGYMPGAKLPAGRLQACFAYV